jgi:hypothetical protein
MEGVVSRSMCSMCWTKGASVSEIRKEGRQGLSNIVAAY